MFQVQQARPALHHAHTHSHTHSYPQSYSQVAIPSTSSGAGGLQVPRTLARPARYEVRRENIMALEPNLAGSSPEYIRMMLRQKADEITHMTTYAQLPPTLTREQVPTGEYIKARPMHPGATSLHALAVFSTKSNAQDPTDVVYMFPTHMLNLAVECAQLPFLPRTPARMRSDGLVDLPIVHLGLPHPEAFAPIHTYLLNRRADHFLSTLISVHYSLLATPRSSSSSRAAPLDHLDTKLLASLIFQSTAGSRGATIMGALNLVKLVWRNTCALGIFDRDLWAALDLAWAAILEALNLAAGGK